MEKENLNESLETFTDVFLSELEKIEDCRRRRAIACGVLLTFLGNYSCLVDEETKTICNEISLHYIGLVKGFDSNERIDLAKLELIGCMSNAMGNVEDKESAVRPIIFRLICLYSELAVSDKEGVIKCHNLGKKIYTEWKKSTPEVVTLNYLNKREKKSKLPINESELLEKFSF